MKKKPQPKKRRRYSKAEKDRRFLQGANGAHIRASLVTLDTLRVEFGTMHEHHRHTFDALAER